MKTICRKKSLTAAGCETQAGGLAETQERGSHPAYWWRVLVGKGSCLSGKRKSKDRHVFGALAPPLLCVCRNANITFES